ncbi:MAG: HD domain-containing protein [Candidatus Aenigmarchaeota archaeon]|nr:HD domain-containing protein [Candidatus Aenigmarchaeota archaeon]
MYKEILEFLKFAGKLKKIERTGWVTWSNVQNPESVAEHIFRTAVFGLIVADIKKLNTEKVVRMSLLHDLPEAIIGDWDPIAKKKLGMEKWKAKEKDAMEKLLSMLPESIREKYAEAWKEFEEMKTKEAKIVRQIDRLEIIIQALEYLGEGYKESDLKEFFDWHVDEFTDDDLKEIFDLVNKERLTYKLHK